MKIIALTGRAGSGKSTAAAILLEHYGLGPSAARRSFATPLKQMIVAYYTAVGLSVDEINRRLHGDLKDAADDYLMGRTPRHAMQTLGTEWGRHLIHPDLWVESLFMRSSGCDVIIIDDCRFPNEAAAVRSRGGVIIRVVGRSSGEVGQHQSEKQEFDADFIIDNRHGLDELREALIRATNQA